MARWDDTWLCLSVRGAMQTWVKYEPQADGTFLRRVREVYETQPTLDDAKRQRDLHDAQGHGDEFRHAAKVPDIVVNQAIREGWQDSDWTRWANDPDNKHLRTWGGRL